MDHCLRQTVIAGRLAELAGASDRDRATTFYLGLLMNTHCHADAAEQATWFDDDIGFKSEGVETLGWNTAQILAFFVRRLASHGSASARARRLVTFPLRGSGWCSDSWPRTRRWVPGSPSGSASTRPSVSRSARPTNSGTARAYPPSCPGNGSGCRRGWCSWPVRWRCSAGATAPAAAVAMVRRNAGTQFDPALADLFCAFGRRGARRGGRGSGLGRGARRRTGALPPGQRGRTGCRPGGDGGPGGPEVPVPGRSFAGRREPRRPRRPGYSVCRRTTAPPCGGPG